MGSLLFVVCSVVVGFATVEGFGSLGVWEFVGFGGLES
jgi:hypothetical protein